MEIRTQLEDEKTKRIQSENELNVTKQLLEVNNLPFETLLLFINYRVMDNSHLKMRSRLYNNL